MTKRATGTFDVTLTPQPSAGSAEDKADGATLGRMSIDKQFHGDIEGVSEGEMLTAVTEANGSAAYVAVERVAGTLQGHEGTFALMHNGIMTRDSRELTVTVVPGSGTGALAGIAGRMAINIIDKKHLYEFDYTLPDGR